MCNSADFLISTCTLQVVCWWVGWKPTVISQFYLTELRVTHYMYISHKIDEEGLFLPYMCMYVPKGMKSLIKLFRVQDCQWVSLPATENFSYTLLMMIQCFFVIVICNTCRMSDLERTIQGLQNELDNLPDPSDIQVQTYMFSNTSTEPKIMLSQNISKNSNWASYTYLPFMISCWPVRLQVIVCQLINSNYMYFIKEQLSIECCKTKTKPITYQLDYLANLKL